MLVDLVEVEIPRFVVADSVGKHMVDGHQDLVRDCDCGALVAAPSLNQEFFFSYIRNCYRVTFTSEIRL